MMHVLSFLFLVLLRVPYHVVGDEDSEAHVTTGVTISDNGRILVTEDTVWTPSTLGQVVALHKGVTVFPGVHLTMAGSDTDEDDGEGYSGYDGDDDDEGSMKTTPLVLIFAATDTSIQLEKGATLNLTNVVFSGNVSNYHKWMGSGVRGWGDSADVAEWRTVHAHRFRCEGLLTCIQVPTVMVQESFFRAGTAIRATYVTMERCRCEGDGCVVGLSPPNLDDDDHVIADGIQVQDSVFRVDRNAIASGQPSVSVERCRFYLNDEKRTRGLVLVSGQQMSIIDSSFYAHTRGDSYVTAVTCEFACRIERSSFIHFDLAVQTYYPADIHDSVFLGNGIAVYPSAFVSGSYFGRNKCGVQIDKNNAHFRVSNCTFVENALAIRIDASMPEERNGIEDILLFRNFVGLREIHNQVDVTLLENVIGWNVSKKAKFLGASFERVNFLDSLRYHVDFDASESLDLRGSKIYWGNNRTDDQSETEVRSKIRDGLVDGGPGVVLFDVGTTSAPYLHPSFPHAEYRPPLADEALKIMGNILDFTPENPFDIPDLPKELVNIDFTNATTEAAAEEDAEATCEQFPETEITVHEYHVQTRDKRTNCAWLEKHKFRDPGAVHAFCFLSMSGEVARACPRACGTCRDEMDHPSNSKQDEDYDGVDDDDGYDDDDDDDDVQVDVDVDVDVDDDDVDQGDDQDHEHDDDQNENSVHDDDVDEDLNNRNKNKDDDNDHGDNKKDNSHDSRSEEDNIDVRNNDGDGVDCDCDSGISLPLERNHVKWDGDRGVVRVSLSGAMVFLVLSSVSLLLVSCFLAGHLCGQRCRRSLISPGCSDEHEQTMEKNWLVASDGRDAVQFTID